MPDLICSDLLQEGSVWIPVNDELKKMRASGKINLKAWDANDLYRAAIIQNACSIVYARSAI